MKKKLNTGLTCTVDLVELVRACGESGVGRIRLGEIGLDIAFGDTVMHEEPTYCEEDLTYPEPSIDTERDIVDNKDILDQRAEDAVESTEIVEDTLEDLMISDPEAFEELVKQGVDEANK